MGLEAPGDQSSELGSITDMRRGSSSTTVVAMPRFVNASAILQSNKPAAGDHGGCRFPLLDESMDAVHVGHGPQAEDVRESMPGMGGITGSPPWASMSAS